MRVFRRTLFTLFSLAYLIVCPLTVMHAFGYSFRPGAGRALVKTGLIYVSTTPSGASVYLGNRRYTQRTPTTLSGLLPGQYALRVSMKDFRSWERVLPVAPEKATVLENILLLPNQLFPEARFGEALAGLAAVPDTRFILLMAGPLLGDVLVYDWKEDKAWPLLAAHADWRAAKVMETRIIGEGPHVLFRVEQAGQAHWLWVEVRRGEAAIEDLATLLVDPPEMLFWSGPMHRYLFSYQQSWVNRVDLEEHAVSPQWFAGLLGFGISGRNIYALRSDGQCLRVNREGKEEELIAQVPLPKAPPLGRLSRFQIHAVSANLLMLLGDRGELLSTRVPHHLVDGGVVGADWVMRRQKILLWTKQQVGIIRIPDERFEFEKNDQTLQVQWIEYAGEDIQQAAWMDDESHLLVRDRGELVLIDLQPYGPAHAERLGQSASPLVYGEDLGRVYYLEPASRRLVSLRLMPKRERLPLPALEYRASGEPSAGRSP